MKKQVCNAFAVFGLLAVFSLSLPAKDVVINDGFELREPWLEVYWTLEDFEPTGKPLPAHLPPTGVLKFDTNGDGTASFAFFATPFEDDTTGEHGSMEGYLVQQIFVQAGQTYTVSADICYNNC